MEEGADCDSKRYECCVDGVVSVSSSSVGEGDGSRSSVQFLSSPSLFERVTCL